MTLKQHQPTFADKVIAFNKSLRLNVILPDNIRVMNPFKENPQALSVSSAFYKKYYDDHRNRHMILGINPGRFGAGVTGVPFTDTKRMAAKCSLHVPDVTTHEPSSVFVYEFIEAYGGVEVFYKDFYINSPSPLGFVKQKENGKEVNFNYYDSKALQESIRDFMVASMKAHISKGIFQDAALCMGSGKNYQVLSKLNEEYGFFKRLIPIEHPRFIMQYRSANKHYYIDKYLTALKEISGL